MTAGFLNWNSRIVFYVMKYLLKHFLTANTVVIDPYLSTWLLPVFFCSIFNIFFSEFFWCFDHESFVVISFVCVQRHVHIEHFPKQKSWLSGVKARVKLWVYKLGFIQIPLYIVRLHFSFFGRVDHQFAGVVVFAFYAFTPLHFGLFSTVTRLNWALSQYLFLSRAFIFLSFICFRLHI